MILDVKQTKSYKNNEFDILKDGQVIYRATASWFKIMELDSKNKVILTDPDGNTLFHTKYSVVDHFFEYSLPFKYWRTGQRKFCVYQIMDASEHFTAVFYTVERRLYDVRLCISFGDRVIYGYRKCIGLRDMVSFYENDVQIGQLTHYSIVVDNLDQYYVHFLPEYDDLQPLIAMYAVFYDFLYHNHNLAYKKGRTVSMYSNAHTVHDDKYHEDFIRTHFGEQEAQRLDTLAPQELSEEEKKDFRNVFLIGCLVPLGILAVVFFLLWFFGTFLS